MLVKVGNGVYAATHNRYDGDVCNLHILSLYMAPPLLGRTGGVVELVLGSVFIIELDTGLAGIFFHRYYTEYDVCHKQNT